MKVLKFSFLALCACFGLGVGVAHFVGAVLMCSSVALALSLSFLLWYQLKLDSTLRCIALYFLSFCCTCFSLGLWVCSLHKYRACEHHYSKYACQGQKHFLEIEIVGELKSTAKARRYVALLSHLDGKRTTGQLLLYAKASEGEYALGQRFVIYQRLQDIRAVQNPFQFDYKQYLAKQGISHQLQLNGAAVYVLPQSSSFKMRWVHGRLFLIGKLEQLGFNQSQLAFIHALVFGQRQELSAELIDQFKRTGTVHVLAVSGLHVGILYMVFFAFAKRLFGSVIGQYIFSVMALWCFAGLTGFAPTVVRAVMMFSILAAAKLIRRDSPNYFGLGLAFFAMLCINPDYLMDVGFQLSFSAVFAIFYFQAFFRVWSWQGRWLTRYLKQLIAVSLSAQLGIMPWALYYFHEFSTLFLAANLVVIPLVSACLISLIVLMCIAVLWSSLAFYLHHLVKGLIDALLAVISILGQSPKWLLTNIPFNSLLAVCAVVLLACLGRFLTRVRIVEAQRLLCVGCALQLVYMGSAFWQRSVSELLLLSSGSQLTLFHLQNGLLTIHTRESDPPRSALVDPYVRSRFVKEIDYRDLQSVCWLEQKQILIVDSAGLWQTQRRADFLVFGHKVRENYDRIVQYHQPRAVIASAAVEPWELSRIRQSCLKKNIPFHAVAEKGYYKF